MSAVSDEEKAYILTHHYDGRDDVAKTKSSSSATSSASPAEWALVLLQYVIFLLVVLLSWVFIWNGIKDAGLDKVAIEKLGVALKKLGLDGQQRRGDGGSRASSQPAAGGGTGTGAKPGRAARTSGTSNSNPATQVSSKAVAAPQTAI